MMALRTGQPVADAVVGISNPQLGQTRWLRINATPLFAPGQDQPRQVYTIFKDITEIIESNRAPTRVKDELR